QASFFRKPGMARAVPASRATAQALPGLPVFFNPIRASTELARRTIPRIVRNRRAQTTAHLPPRWGRRKRLARGACTAPATPDFLYRRMLGGFTCDPDCFLQRG